MSDFRAGTSSFINGWTKMSREFGALCEPKVDSGRFVVHAYF